MRRWLRYIDRSIGHSPACRYRQGFASLKQSQFWHFHLQNAGERLSLKGTSFSQAVQNLEFRQHDLLEQHVRFCRQLVTVDVLLEDFYTGPVHHECVVQNEKVIVQDAQRVALRKRNRYLLMYLGVFFLISLRNLFGFKYNDVSIVRSISFNPS